MKPGRGRGRRPPSARARFLRGLGELRDAEQDAVSRLLEQSYGDHPETAAPFLDPATFRTSSASSASSAAPRPSAPRVPWYENPVVTVSIVAIAAVGGYTAYRAGKRTKR